MVNLVEVRNVRSRLALPDDDGINEAIVSSIGAALPALRAALQTEFDFGSSTDIFFIDPVGYMALGGFYTLKARNGFMKKATVKVAVASSFDELQLTATTITPPIILEEKGFVRVPESYVGQYVKLEYDYGFTDSDEIPGWLVEVAITYVAKVLSSQQIVDQNPAMVKLYAFINQHGGGIMDAHLRVMSEAVRPLN